MPVPRPIDADPAQPGAEGTGVPQLRELLPRRDEGLLRDVGCIGRSDDRRGQAKRLARMLLDKHLERLPIAGLGTADQLQCCSLHWADTHRTPVSAKVFGRWTVAPPIDSAADMALPDDLRMRDATLADLPAIADQRESAGWAAHEWALRYVVTASEARCVVVEDNRGNLVAVGSGVGYGELGVVGNMIVAEAHRRRGIGRAVLDAVVADLRDRGVRRLELYATTDGRRLYERAGFGYIQPGSRVELPRSASLAPDPTLTVDEGTAAAEIAAYDAPRFGGDRSGLLSHMADDPSRPMLVARRAGTIAGLCVAEDRRRAAGAVRGRRPRGRGRAGGIRLRAAAGRIGPDLQSADVERRGPRVAPRARRGAETRGTAEWRSGRTSRDGSRRSTATRWARSVDDHSTGSSCAPAPASTPSRPMTATSSRHSFAAA